MNNNIITLNIDAHKKYFLEGIKKGLEALNKINQDVPLQLWVENNNKKSVMLNGMYWCISGLTLLGNLTDILDKREILFHIIQQCRCMKTGGYKPHPEYGNSALATLSAIQILDLLNYPLNNNDVIIISTYVSQLQDKITGGFFLSHPLTSKWTNEPDLRFVLCNLAILKHIGVLDASSSTPIIDKKAVIEFILLSQSDDGGFGKAPSQHESHGGFVYCAIASLSLLNALDQFTGRTSLKRFIKQRFHHYYHNDNNSIQNFILVNGRPNKTPDVCYMWWLLAAAIILDDHFNDEIDLILTKKEKKELIQGILTYQHESSGGFSKMSLQFSKNKNKTSTFFSFLNPGLIQTHDFIKPDPFHSYFALAALSLLSLHINNKEFFNFNLLAIDPRTAFPLYSHSI